jgi:hypothetical protein
MKTGMTVFAALSVAVILIVAGGCAPGKYVAKQNEQLYGTWTNQQNVGGVLSPQKAVVTVDGNKLYSKISDSVPSEENTFQIDSKWTDSEGNIWYKIFGTVTMGAYKGARWQELEKLSKSGTVWERALNALGASGEFNPQNYPPRIDPKYFEYRILYRAEK